MKTEAERERRFTSGGRFEIAAVHGPPFTVGGANPLDDLKDRLVAERLETGGAAMPRRRLLVAANEAAALATNTAYPLLVFPVLFEEKAESRLSGGAFGQIPLLVEG